MRIRDIMTRQIVAVGPQNLVSEAAQLMQKHDIGILPVCEDEKVIGILTDRDIVVRNIAHGRDPHSTPVKDVMTTNVTTVKPEMDFEQATQVMGNKQIRRLPVVENNRLIGMVALGDLATKNQFDLEVSQALEKISQPSTPENM